MSKISELKNKNLDIIMAPVLVLLFAALLAMMYGWVGTTRSVGGEMAETPEGRWVAANGPVIGMGIGDGVNGQMALINTPPANNAQPAHHLPAPAGLGIGNGANGQMQLINIPPSTAQPAHHLPAPAGLGIGNGANGQMQLINKPPMQIGIGKGADAQLLLINARPPVYLGAKFGAVTDPLAATFGLTTTRGVHIQAVSPNTPADKAGLQLDDILLGIDRQQINDLDTMLRILSVKQPGDTVKIVYFRHGKQKSGFLTLGTPPDLLPVAANTPLTNAPPAKTGNGLPWLGAEIQNIDAVIQTQYQLANKRGVIVSYVSPNSPAEQAGLINGDVVVRCNRTNVKDVARFQNILSELKAGSSIELIIIRSGQEQNLTLVLGDKALAPVVKPAQLQPAEMLVEGSWIGMDVTELTPPEAEELGFPAGTSGVLVNDVESPPATTVGFQTGDLIIAVNSTPTLNMKDFVQATRLQNGAVVDVLRGNRHLFVTVPPPGFSQQGTALPTNPPPNNFQQVAAIKASPGRLAIIVAGPSLGAPIAGEQQPSASLLLVDPAENSFTSMALPNFDQMQDVIKHNQVVALICSDISARSAAGYAVTGVKVYTGMVGTADQALGLYRAGNLMAMN